MAANAMPPRTFDERAQAFPARDMHRQRLAYILGEANQLDDLIRNTFGTEHQAYGSLIREAFASLVERCRECTDDIHDHEVIRDALDSFVQRYDRQYRKLKPLSRKPDTWASIDRRLLAALADKNDPIDALEVAFNGDEDLAHTAVNRLPGLKDKLPSAKSLIGTTIFERLMLALGYQGPPETEAISSTVRKARTTLEALKKEARLSNRFYDACASVCRQFEHLLHHLVNFYSRALNDEEVRAKWDVIDRSAEFGVFLRQLKENAPSLIEQFGKRYLGTFAIEPTPLTLGDINYQLQFVRVFRNVVTHRSAEDTRFRISPSEWEAMVASLPKDWRGNLTSIQFSGEKMLLTDEQLWELAKAGCNRVEEISQQRLSPGYPEIQRHLQPAAEGQYYLDEIGQKRLLPHPSPYAGEEVFVKQTRFGGWVWVPVATRCLPKCIHLPGVVTVEDQDTFDLGEIRVLSEESA